MEDEEVGFVGRRDSVKRYPLTSNPSTDTLLDGSTVGEGVDTGSTVARDLFTDATSHRALADDGPARGGAEDDEENSRGFDAVPSGGSGGVISELTATTENAYGGGLYGTDEASPPPAHPAGAGHASDFQSAEGLASDMPDRKDVRAPPSSGDRDLDITGQSYIQ